jgi:hypothetical protein
MIWLLSQGYAQFLSFLQSTNFYGSPLLVANAPAQGQSNGTKILPLAGALKGEIEELAPKGGAFLGYAEFHGRITHVFAETVVRALVAPHSLGNSNSVLDDSS